jgi:hypothetical protein
MTTPFDPIDYATYSTTSGYCTETTVYYNSHTQVVFELDGFCGYQVTAADNPQGYIIPSCPDSVKVNAFTYSDTTSQQCFTLKFCYP